MDSANDCSANDSKYYAKDSNVKRLKWICCDCIVREDWMLMVESIAEILPFEILEYLILKMDEFQFGQLHGYFWKAGYFGKFEMVKHLFMQNYKILKRNMAMMWKFGLVEDEVEYYGRRYWESRMGVALINGTYLQVLEKICTRVPFFVLHVKTRFVVWSAQIVKLLGRMNNVQKVEFEMEDEYFAQMLSLCENWVFLKEVKLICIRENTQWMPWLKCLLEFKMQENKSIAVSICNSYYDCWNSLLCFLGKAAHGISGLQLCATIFRGTHESSLIEYSNVKCIQKLKLRYETGNDDWLLDIIQNAPPSTNDNDALYKLHLENIQVSRLSFNAFQHWRFSRLVNFCMIRVSMRHDEAAMLAKHVTFWPVVKRVILRSCAIPTSGFSVLLPAMVRGKGCNNLMELDVSENDCKTLAPFIEFFDSENLRNLKFISLIGLDNETVSFPPKLLMGIGKCPLAYLDISQVRLKNEQFDKLACSLFSSCNVSLRELRVLPCDVWTSQAHLKNLCTLLEKHNMPCLQPIRAIRVSYYVWSITRTY